MCTSLSKLILLCCCNLIISIEIRDFTWHLSKSETTIGSVWLLLTRTPRAPPKYPLRSRTFLNNIAILAASRCSWFLILKYTNNSTNKDMSTQGLTKDHNSLYLLRLLPLTYATNQRILSYNSRNCKHGFTKQLYLTFNVYQRQW